MIKRLQLFIVIVILTVLNSKVDAQTTVFSDDFNRGAVVSPLSNGGTPTMTWTTVSTNSINAGTSTTNLTSGTDYSLVIQGLAFATREFVLGPLSTFSAPFNTTLRSNTGLITWCFNMKTNRTTALSNFALGNYASVVILGQTTADSTGSGYGVAMYKGTTNNAIRLVKFSNLLATANVTQIGTVSADFAAMTNWVSVKVTYLPSTNTWSLYFRDDASTTTPGDPTTVSTQVGTSTVDATYTSSVMTSCGFYWNHSTSTPSSNTGRYDNFKVFATGTAQAQLTNGIAASPINSSTTNKAILGFSLTESLNTANVTAINFNTSSTNSDKFTNIKLYTSTDNDYSSAGDNTQVTGVTVNQTATQIQLSGFSAGLTTTAKNFFLVADPVSSVGYTTAACQVSLPITGVTVSTGSVTGSTITGTSYTFVSPTDPAILVTGGPLSLGNTVTGTNSSPQTFTVSGSNLTADITITAPSLFQVSTDGSSYGSTKTLTRSGVSVGTTTVYVMFSPSSADGAHSGTVTMSTTGAANGTVSVSGNAISTEPTTVSSAITFTNPASTSLGISWTNGNGASHLVVVRSGAAIATDPTDGISYTASATFASGTAIGAGYVVYNSTGSSVTVTGLTKGTWYFVNVYELNGSGGTENYRTSTFATSYQMAAGTVTSAGSGVWQATGTWVGGALPTASDNVVIASGHTVQDTCINSPYALCANLTVNSGGVLLAGADANHASSNIGSLYLKIIRFYGSSIVNNGQIGAADGSDGLRLDIYNSTTLVTLSGTNTIKLAKLLQAVASPGVKFSVNTNFYYRASAAGSGSGYQISSGAGIGFANTTIDAGVTVTNDQYTNFSTTASNSTDGTVNWTVDIYGTVNCGSNSAFNLRTGTGYTGNLNIRSGGTVSIGTNFQMSTTSGTPSGGPTNVTCDGTLNLGSGSADFSSAAQTITGTGSVILPSGGTITIGSANGLTASAASGPIQTTTRSFNSNANYTYTGSAAGQVTGDGLPATVSSLTCSNTAGLSLTGNVTVNGVLTVSGGDINTNGNTITLGSTGSITESTTNLVTGTVTVSRDAAQGVNNTFGGIGVSINAADAAPGITSVTRVTGTALTSNGGNSIKRYYTITPTNNSGLNAAVVFKYNDRVDELNGVSEANLRLWKSTDGRNSWSIGGFGTVDAVANTVSASGISDFSDWTLGDVSVPLPVELTSLTSSITGGKVVLNWKTATEVNNSFFSVERSKQGVLKKWLEVGKVLGSGNSSSPKSYAFTDSKLNESGVYVYRLIQHDNDGTKKELKSIEVNATLLPTVYVLDQNYPNPFNPSTEIRYGIPEDARVMISIYSITGSLIKTVLDEFQSAGFHTVNYDAGTLSSGTYIYQMTAGTFKQTKKLVILK